MNLQKSNSRTKEIIFYILGILLVVSFLLLYSSRFLNKPILAPGLVALKNLMGMKGVIIVNSLIFLLFILFIPYRKKIEWKSKSVFAAFILALFAEMFGIPLMIFLSSPVFGSSDAIPISLPWLGKIYLFKHYFPFGWPGVVVGSYLTLAGMITILSGWSQIHKAEKLVTTGLYKWIRHPQYLGMFLLLTGWMLHWATTLTLIMYPILLFVYYSLSRKEEKDMINEFGEAYLQYSKTTGMYLPRLFIRKNP